MGMNANTVELIGHYGGDRSHAMAAWASTGQELTEEKVRLIPNLLINKLARQKPPHTSPFEHSLLHFRVQGDIPTHIHFIKHRTFGINSQSARYMELKEDNFYVPTDWPEEMRATGGELMQIAFDCYHQAIERLVKEQGFTRSRAKESARYLLPLGMQYRFVVKCDLLNFAHFLQLRLHPHAQKEVRDLARAMLDQVRALPGDPFRHSLAAYGHHDPDYVFPPDTSPDVPDLTATRGHDPVFEVADD